MLVHRCLFISLLAVSLLPGTSKAEDDFSYCTPPWHFIGETGGIVLRAPIASRFVGPGAAHSEMCVTVPKSGSVVSMKCFISVWIDPEHHHKPAYTCKMAEPCFNRGIFERAFRRNFDAKQDQLCAIYTNSTGSPTNVAVGFTLDTGSFLSRRHRAR